METHVPISGVENIQTNNQIVIFGQNGDRYTIAPVISVNLTNPNEKDDNKQISEMQQEPKPIHCSSCDLYFADSTQLVQHDAEMHDTSGIPCNACNKHFSCQEYLRRHILAVHSELTPTICPICRQDFKRLDILALHSMDCQADSKYHCRECDFMADTLLKLEEHETGHALERHVCSDCGTIFKRRDHLTRHYRSRHMMESVECALCFRVFRRKDHMLRHVREIHGKTYIDGKFLKIRSQNDSSKVSNAKC